MPQFGTPSVAVATTPTVISTFFSHLLARKNRKTQSKKSLTDGGPGGGPENELSYEEGLKVVRRFLEFASRHGVEEVQAFTAMKVPNSPWVKRDVVRIPQLTITRAEDILSKHLDTYGPDREIGGGLKLIGGDQWWRIRGRELEGEWIEKDYLRRTSENNPDPGLKMSKHPHAHRHTYLPRRANTDGGGSVKDNSGAEVTSDRVILYIHGGAYFFSSLDTHRYQIQRHARKAGARAFAPAYRLAPQYPFPCGLLDALASYLYLIDPPPDAHVPISPTSIIFMGDSAGAGMVVSLLVIIREMGLPMPAGASLISPWVDLTHSMPSIGGWDGGDFIPNTGFHYKPSVAWPPAPGDGITVTMPNGTEAHFDEQVQMYCPNNLLSHPLVSPVNLGSLGGLCPLLITGGGGELLRDEIMYLAHKAAEPTTYRPSSFTLSQYPDQAAMIEKYKPTRVHLQIYEGCCHVVPTLAITKSAKYMYRACANFNIWAYTAAGKALDRKVQGSQRRHKHSSRDPSRSNTAQTSSTSAPSPIDPKLRPFTQADLTSSPTVSRRQSFTDIAAGNASTAPSSVGSQVDLTQPIITSSSAHMANQEELDEDDVQSEAGSSESDSSVTEDEAAGDQTGPSLGTVTVSGREPVFSQSHIVSERISTHGKIRPFEPIDQVPALNPNLRELIGQVHGDGAIHKWLEKRAEWDKKYSSQHQKWREIKLADRQQAEQAGFLTRQLQGERPPLCSLAGWFDVEKARAAGKSVDEISGKTSNMMMMWQRISQKPDRDQAGGETMAEIKEGVEEGLRRKSVNQQDQPTNL